MQKICYVILKNAVKYERMLRYTDTRCVLLENTVM